MTRGDRIRPFTIEIPESALLDLARRLTATRLPQAIVTDWSDGTDVAYLSDLVAYWRDAFDWRAQERRFNALPQFLVRVGELDVHVVHARGRGPNPLPLIVTHGWPGSFIEMLDIIPRLTDPERFGGDPRDSFDVVVPSLPGYGFSEGPRSAGTGPKQIAAMWVALMSALGYERFAAQGGDWGAAVSTQLGMDHAEHVIGVHLNYMMRAHLPSRARIVDPTAEEIAYFDASDRWTALEGGYAHLQGTKPQTLAYALLDSPAGLAAYIIEKFRTWSDCDGDVESAFPKDTLLSNIAVYWFTRTIGSAMHLYWERARAPSFAPQTPPPVPFAFAAFPKELTMTPRSLIARAFRLERYTTMAHGGHFAALERPADLAADVAAFFRNLR